MQFDFNKECTTAWWPVVTTRVSYVGDLEVQILKSTSRGGQKRFCLSFARL